MAILKPIALFAIAMLAKNTKIKKVDDLNLLEEETFKNLKKEYKEEKFDLLYFFAFLTQNFLFSWLMTFVIDFKGFEYIVILAIIILSFVLTWRLRCIVFEIINQEENNRKNKRAMNLYIKGKK